MSVSRGSRLVVLLAAILAACSGTTTKAGRRIPRVAQANQALFQYNRQREEWERTVPQDTVEISQKKLARIKDAPPLIGQQLEVRIQELNEMKQHFESGGNLEVAYKHQNDGITVFRTDMHENQLEEKRREVAAGHAKRIDPHLAFELALGFQRDRKDLSPALYHAVMHANPEHFSAYFNMGSWLHAKGNPGEAKKLFEVAHRLLPGHVLPQISLAELYAQTGNLPQALMMLTKLDHAGAFSSMSKLLKTMQADGSDNADMAMGRSLRLRVMIATAILLQHQGMLVDAQTEYQRIIDEYEDDFDPSGNPDTHFAPIIWLNYGNVCHQLGQEKEAEKLWAKAVALLPKLTHFVPNIHTQILNGHQPMYNQPMWPIWDDVLVDASTQILHLHHGNNAKLK